MRCSFFIYFLLFLLLYIYICIYIHTHIYIYIYTYTHDKPYLLMLPIWFGSRRSHSRWVNGHFNFSILVFTPPPEHKISKISSAIFLPWIYHEFSLNPPRRVIQMSMKDGGIVAKLGHHEELFANYLFFVANFGNQIFTIPPYSEKKQKW